MTTATQKRIRTYTPIKRAIDVLLSGIGILVLSPILLILCVAIKLTLRDRSFSLRNG